MSSGYNKFYATNGKRLILIVDDEENNRLFLRDVLSAQYDILYASDGEEALNVIRKEYSDLSLILLDLNMPKLNGLEVLNKIKASEELSHIPVIMMTSDHSAEEECLRLGASDFLPKPYPYSGVISARVYRLIELFENRDIILSTERDSMTGLYTRDYFLRLAEQFDKHHKNTPMDALVIDINRFHIFNERFGVAYGDKIIKNLADILHKLSIDLNAIVCRRIGDIFLFYCPHLDSVKSFYDTINERLAMTDEEPPKIRIGVYPNVNKSLSMIQRFTRAKIAADTVKHNPGDSIAVYDNALHYKQLYREQLLADFPQALAKKQFVVYFQPKFDVRYDKPKMVGAEALVRWNHPKLGTIGPMDFIPLLEENGLIFSLDQYVWDTAAKQIKDWIDRFGVALPVSVNMSRIDMYEPSICDVLLDVVEKNGLTPKHLFLEITESAYAQDCEQIVATANKLRSYGFRTEMDDFGSGYSSLNMLFTLPIDALKVDMHLVQNALNNKSNIRMLEIIIDIAEFLAIPVLSEGVETRDQLTILKGLGYDYVQGYFFSKPVEAKEFDKFFTGDKDIVCATQADKAYAETHKREIYFGKIAGALFSDYESIFYVDLQTEHYVEYLRAHDHSRLNYEKTENNFFKDVYERAKDLMSPADRERFNQILAHKQEILSSMQEKPFSIIYRLNFHGTPAWYNMKAVMSKDGTSMVVGIFSIDEALRDVHPFDET